MKNKKIWLLIILLSLFIINTILVKCNIFVNIDNVVHEFIYSFRSPNLDNFMKSITVFGSTKFVIIICALIVILLFLKKKYRYSIILPAVLIISTIINNVIKPVINRMRPEYIMIVEKSLSYPSGHMMASVSLYGMVIYLLKNLNIKNPIKYIFMILLIVLISLIGISRIYLGAHYFSDILGATLLSASLIVIASIIDECYKN